MVCVACGFSLASWAEYRDHVACSHARVLRGDLCPFCLAALPLREQRMRHIRAHHALGVDCGCPFCDASFLTFDDAARHAAVCHYPHRGSNHITCFACRAAFDTVQDFLFHVNGLVRSTSNY